MKYILSINDRPRPGSPVGPRLGWIYYTSMNNGGSANSSVGGQAKEIEEKGTLGDAETRDPTLGRCVRRGTIGLGGSGTKSTLCLLVRGPKFRSTLGETSMSRYRRVVRAPAAAVRHRVIINRYHTTRYELQPQSRRVGRYVILFYV